MGLRELYAEREANDPSIHITNCRGKSKSTLCHPDPDFLYVAPSMTACAAFSKESRMRFASANELHRKSGGAKARDLRFHLTRNESTCCPDQPRPWLFPPPGPLLSPCLPTPRTLLPAPNRRRSRRPLECSPALL